MRPANGAAQNVLFFGRRDSMKLHHLAAVSLAAITSIAGAQGMKPGLWEISNNMRSSDPDLEAAMAERQQAMASMPPEQRKKMEEMMARQGVKMGQGGGMSIQMCMTREMAERNEMPAQQRGDCKSTQQPRSGNTMKMSFVCTNPPSSGEGQFTFTSPEAYSMKMAMKTIVNGKPETINMDSAGKWLGADCGNVKPIAPPKK
jgi:hypothetical protein